jgi:hypothetical protein
MLEQFRGLNTWKSRQDEAAQADEMDGNLDWVAVTSAS